MTRFRAYLKNLSVSERRILAGVVIGAVVLSSIPYLFGVVRAGSDYVYLGLYPSGPADTNVYFSFMRQTMEGSVLIENLHTGEPQQPSLFHPLWLILGWIAGLFRLSIPFVFHLARIVLIAIFLLFFSFFTSSVFPDARRRTVALVLAAFSSGIGIFFSTGVPPRDAVQAMLLLPSDQWITESNTFLTFLHSPLFILSQLLLLVLFWCWIHEKTIQRFTIVAALFGLLVLLHPYDVVTVAALSPVFVLLRMLRDPTMNPAVIGRLMKRLAALAIIALPVLVYYALIGKLEPAIGGWTAQNVTTSPLPHSYILGYGFLLVFAVPGFVAWRRTRERSRLFLLTWIVVSALLLYVPLQFNRRFSSGFHLPLVLLATVGLDLFWLWLKRVTASGTLRMFALRSFVGWMLGIGLFFSTIAVVFETISWARSPSDNSVYYRHREVVDAMQWLGRATPRDAVILSHSYNGNSIPTWSGRRVYIGHGHQTVDLAVKRDRLSKWFFLTNTDDDAKEAFLRTAGIGYLFFSEFEDDLGFFEPEEKTYLRPVFRNARVTIYTALPADRPQNDR